jgi:hypothetical protein
MTFRREARSFWHRSALRSPAQSRCRPAARSARRERPAVTRASPGTRFATSGRGAPATGSRQGPRAPIGTAERRHAGTRRRCVTDRRPIGPTGASACQPQGARARSPAFHIVASRAANVTLTDPTLERTPPPAVCHRPTSLTDPSARRSGPARRCGTCRTR